MGDFNFYWSLSNRNSPGGNIADTLIFNDAIGHLGLIELPIKGQAFTWSNMQSDPLLEQLDWFFTSPNWTLEYPNTEVLPLAKITSDHIPCKIAISTSIPRSSIFRFENFWAAIDSFVPTVQECWANAPSSEDSAMNISIKLKKLRYSLKAWSRCLSNLKLLIDNCNSVICHLDGRENSRNLFNPESNLRRMVKRQLQTLLHYKNLYWRKRHTVNRIKLGDECTKYFHAMATISFRKNSISKIINDHGVIVQDHEGKAGLLWLSFKNRMGVTTAPTMHFDLSSLFQPVDGLEGLSSEFLQSEIDNTVAHLPLDKAPGPDGFNGLFLRKCWPIIKHDYYKLCADFFDGRINMESFNRSFITLKGVKRAYPVP